MIRMPDGQVVFEISADGRKAMASIEDVTRALQKAGQSWEGMSQESTGKIGDSFKGMFKTISVAAVAATVGKTLLEWGKAAVEAASDLQEVQNVVDVTFGDSANQINSWAKTAIQQFGLTETKAKQFASTIGAMMKSAGVASTDIVDMSENLAGLAADMASFYNLDFDTAFQKIRSGISGETEPLKQLGINMSVANLEAFALKQGLEKTFDQMTQGEQTMLRYQYIMQATSDAQGDFARTSDGYANSQRLLASNLESLKTKFGELLVGPLAELTSWANTTLTKLTTPAETTVIDRFNEIEVDTAAKLQEIKTISDQANTLIGVLESIGAQKIDDTTFKTVVGEIATEFGSLESSLTTAQNKDFAGQISKIAGALELQTGTSASTWGEFLSNIAEKLPDATDATSADTSTAAFLEAAGKAAEELGGNAPGLWKQLLEALGTENAANALRSISGLYNSAGTMGTLASGANVLNATASGRWSNLLSAFDKSSTFKDVIEAAKNNDYSGVVSGLSDALSKTTNFKKDDWETMLTTLAKKVPDASNKLANEGVSGVLTAIAGAADDLGGEYPAMWAEMVNALGSETAASMIAALSGGQNAGDNLEGIADGANKLGYGTGSRWSNVLSSFNNSESFKDVIEAAKNNDYKGVVSGLAEALSESTNFKKDDWANMLDTLAEKVPNLREKLSTDGVSGVLSDIAEAANSLGGEYPAMWQAMVDALGGDTAAAMMTSLSGGQNAGTYLGLIAEKANLLDANSSGHWQAFMQSVQRVTGSTFGNNAANAARQINTLAQALSGKDLNQTRGEAFQNLITTLMDNADDLTELSGTDAEGTKQFLSSIATAANELDPNDANGWNTLMTALVTGLSGGVGTDAGDSFFSSMAQQFLAMGNQSDAAVTGLKALGYTTDEIEESQKMWLKTCKDLVQTIPGISEIVDVTTGEIKGGTDALKTYVDEWKRQQEAILLWKAHFAKQAALAENEGSIYALKLDVITAEVKVEDIEKELREKFEKAFRNVLSEEDYSYVIEQGLDYMINFESGAGATIGFKEDIEALDEVIARWQVAELARKQATEKWQKQADAQSEKTEELNKEEEALSRTVGEYEDAARQAAEATGELSEEQQAAAAAAQTSADALRDALLAVQDYAESVRRSTESSVEGVLKGFQSIETPAQKARNTVKDLESQITEANSKEINIKIAAENDAIPTIQNMTKGLKDQLAYMQQYQAYMAQARARGVSEDILSMLADGSQESFDYLEALATGAASSEAIEELNAKYKEVQDASKQFTDTLTEQKLSTDEAFEDLVKKANEAVAGIDLGDESKKAAINTMQGLLNGLQELEPSVADTVAEILAIIGQLSGDFTGFTVNGTSFSYGVRSASSVSGNSRRSNDNLHSVAGNAVGLEYVPYDGYFSVLHEGESILTAEEAKIWRDYRYGAAARGGMDYDSLSGSIWEHAPKMGGGNVYLDGQTVGRVISARQADSYRALERSGWQQ